MPMGCRPISDISYQLTKGLLLASNLGYSMSNGEAWSLTPIKSQNPALNPTGQTIHSRSSSNAFLFEPQLSYDTWIGKGRLSMITGATIKRSEKGKPEQYGHWVHQ